MKRDLKPIVGSFGLRLDVDWSYMLELSGQGARIEFDAQFEYTGWLCGRHSTRGPA